MTTPSENENQRATLTGQRSQTLYRKWRSQTFDELVGQDAITRTLQNAITAGRVGHAYLFCGPRGTGKTSTGRLLAKAINCLDPDPTVRPCDKCEPCRSISEGRAMDLIEIDAASNRGIDEVRELRDKINFQPTCLKKKVYIIDEVHMMTEPAFNALLKTLEEPPPHAVFILATTDPQDIPATVVSRCQRFDFQRISLAQSVARLTYVCQQENITVETGALEMVARQATGSLRDALSLLDQLIVFSGGAITVEAVRRMLGVMNIEAVADFVESLAKSDLAGGLEQINRLMQAGTDLKRFNRELVEHLRNLMLLKVNPQSRELADMTEEALAHLQTQAGGMELWSIVAFLKVFSTVDYNLKVSAYGQLPLELALMECLLGQEQQQAEQTVKVAEIRPATYQPVARPQPPARTPAPTPTAPAVVASEPESKAKEQPTAAPVVETSSAESQAGAAIELAEAVTAWKQVLKNLESQSKMTAALLKEANPVEVEGNRVVLGFNYTFHYKRISQDQAAMKMLEEHFTRVMGQKIGVKCIDQSEAKNTGGQAGTAAKPGAKTASKDDELTRRAAQIFNARIVD
jgi:DNA polymerase III subunit gamma/tau